MSGWYIDSIVGRGETLQNICHLSRQAGIEKVAHGAQWGGIYRGEDDLALSCSVVLTSGGSTFLSLHLLFYFGNPWRDSWRQVQCLPATYPCPTVSCDEPCPSCVVGSLRGGGEQLPSVSHSDILQTVPDDYKNIATGRRWMCSDLHCGRQNCNNIKFYFSLSVVKPKTSPRKLLISWPLDGVIVMEMLTRILTPLFRILYDFFLLAS